jgi:hypothetical protein
VAELPLGDVGAMRFRDLTIIARVDEAQIYSPEMKSFSILISIISYTVIK